MGPIWGRQDPGGPHVGPMNFAVWLYIIPESIYILESNGINNNQIMTSTCVHKLFLITIIHNTKHLCTIVTRQIWGIWKLRPAYSPETPNLGQNRWCFVPCDLEIWWMTLENNRASLLCCFKLCATFRSHLCIQTLVTVQKRPIWVKFDNF